MLQIILKLLLHMATQMELSLLILYEKNPQISVSFTDIN